MSTANLTGIAEAALALLKQPCDETQRQLVGNAIVALQKELVEVRAQLSITQEAHAELCEVLGRRIDQALAAKTKPGEPVPVTIEFHLSTPAKLPAARLNHIRQTVECVAETLGCEVTFYKPRMPPQEQCVRVPPTNEPRPRAAQEQR